MTVRTLESPLTLPLSGDGRTLTVPAGVMVYIPSWWVHRAPANFPDHPDVFDPDRFFVPERAARIHRYEQPRDVMLSSVMCMLCS